MEPKPETLRGFLGSQLRFIEQGIIGAPSTTSARYALLQRVQRGLDASTPPNLADFQRLVQDYYQEGAFHEGERLLRAAAREDRMRWSDEHDALVLRWLGVFRLRLGRTAEGTADLWAAKEAYAELRDAENVTKCFRDLATAHAQAGELEEATRFFRHALFFSGDVADPHPRVSVRLNLSILHHKRGLWREALREFREAWREQRAVTRESLQTNLRLEGTLILRHLGFARLAEAWGEAALRQAERCRFTRGEALALLFLGDIHHDVGDLEKSLHHYRSALAATVESAPDGDLVVDCYRRLAEVYLARGELALCERALCDGLNKVAITKDELDRVGLLRVLGQLALLYGHVRAGTAAFADALELCRTRRLRFEEALTHETLGRALADAGRPREARPHREEAAQRYRALDLPRLARRQARGGRSLSRGLTARTRWLAHGICAADARTLDVLERGEALVAQTTSPLLISGEPGTGRRALASALHRLGRGSARVTEVNAASFPSGRTLAEALDAATGRENTLERERRAGGLLLLRDLHLAPASFHEELLALLASRSSPHVIATADPLALERQPDRGGVSADLFDWLGTRWLELPPLRERARDIVPLAHHFVRVAWPYRRPPHPALADDASGALLAYDWRRGNVAELRRVILGAHDRLGPGNRVTLDHLPAFDAVMERHAAPHD